MSNSLDQQRLKELAISVWCRGGMDALIKVMPWGFRPAPDKMVGYCTTFKFVVGRTPAQMERDLGFRPDTKLAAGAEIFAVKPLPAAHEFELRSYSTLPAGVPTNVRPYHVDYPPGTGVPQWELSGAVQKRSLIWLAAVPAGKTFQFPVSRLPPP